ncbi:MAG TPA: hypothetical protein VG710_00095 [Opitutus sp.]|nr:hypothetical protein [Opitutus sp.]
MDDDFRELEAELRNLRPATVSRGLLERIARELDEPVSNGSAAVGRNHDKGAWVPWVILPIAAAIAFAVALPRQPAQSPGAAEPDGARGLAAAPAFKPVSAQNLLVSSRDEGYVTLADGTRARRIRQSYVDTITWKNPRTKASLTWSLPREEVRVTPISYE